MGDVQPSALAAVRQHIPSLANGQVPFGHCDPFATAAEATTMQNMNSASQLRNCASDVVAAARRFEAAAQAPESYPGAPDSLAALEEALQLLSAAWYRLAADASPGLADRRHAVSGDGRRRWAIGLSREQEVSVLATLHDVAAAFAGAARASRTGRSRIARIIEYGVAATRPLEPQAEPARRVA